MLDDNPITYQEKGFFEVPLVLGTDNEDIVDEIVIHSNNHLLQNLEKPRLHISVYNERYAKKILFKQSILLITGLILFFTFLGLMAYSQAEKNENLSDK